MEDIGEQIDGAWLSEVAGCEFVEYRVRTRRQGEIDVVGLSLQHDHAYLCEVATHIHGLWYANSTKLNVKKLVDKFTRAAEWAEHYLGRFPKRTYMLWTPVVKRSRSGAKLDQTKSIETAKLEIKRGLKIDLEVATNESYRNALEQLRKIARNTTFKPNSPVLRVMQIEEWNRKQLSLG